MLEYSTSPLLVDFFEDYLRKRDLETFRAKVLARYSEGTLARISRLGDVQARRAAVLALGLVGSFEVNANVAFALKDQDPTVRILADQALWSIWFRADSLENNTKLESIRALIGIQKYGEAIEQAADLIARSPNFAEAYNQRAVALFCLGRFDESVADCRRVLERNPYHTGALSGMGQCYLRLDRVRDALATYRRALKLQPYQQGLRDLIEALETPRLDKE